MGLLALMLMLATPSFAQVGLKPMKAKKTTAFEQANLRAEFYKQHPALVKAPKAQKKDKSGLVNTVVGRLKVKHDPGALKLGDGTALLGNLIYEDSGENETGLYSFQSNANPVLDEIATDSYLAATGGGVVIDNKVYFASYEILLIWYFMYHFVYDLNTNSWEVQAEDEDFSNIAVGSCVAYDESTKLAYGLYYDAEAASVQFCSMDYPNWKKTVIGDGILEHADEYMNFSCDGKGNLYGITFNGEVYKIDVNTKEETLFTTTGMQVPTYIQAATINPATNTLYWNFVKDDGSGILQIDLATGKSSIAGYFLNNEEMAILAPITNEVAPGAPGRAVNLKAYVENDAPNDVKVSFSLPELAYDGVTTLSGVLEYTIFVNDEVYLKGSGQPGAAIIRNIPNVNSGKTVIKVIVTNAVGDSPAAKTQLWAGPDAPKSPAPATLSVDEAGNATVTWTAVNLEGAHHGYVDTDNVVYRVVRYPENVVVAEDAKGTTLKETIDVSNLKMVSYGITAVNGEAESEEAITNAVKVGTSYGTPSGDDFSDETTFGLYTVVDANEDGSTWILNYGIPSAQYNSSNEADDWLITAPVKLEAGKLYILTCEAGPYSTYYVPERIEVALGKGVDPSAFGTQIIDPTDLYNKVTLTGSFSVEADGEYNIGFHSISDADMFYTQLYSWSISAPIDFGAPDKPFNAAIVPTEPGAFTANIQFNAPLKAINGEDLTGKLTVKVTGEDFEEVLTDVDPGSLNSIPVEFDEAGVYSFTITPSNDKGEGLPVIVSKFIGRDAPKDVQNITAYDNFDGTATFTWDQISEEGVNGGYVDPSDVTYVIYNITEDGYLGDVLTETKDLSYVYASDRINNGPIDLLQLVVQAVNEQGESDYAVGGLVAGTPDAIPYSEPFPAGSIANYWWVSYYDTNDDPSDDASLDSWTLSGDDVDGSGGCAGFMSSRVDEVCYLNSGKISVKGAVNPKLLFTWIALPSQMKIRVLGDRQDGKEPVELKVIDCNELTSIEWKNEVVDLSAFVNDPYFIVMFEAVPEETGAIFEFDAVKIYDVYSNDLAVEITSAPRAVNVGDQIMISALVKNIGSTDVAADDFTVKFTVNGKEVLTQPGEDLDAYNDMAAYVFSYNTTVFDPTPTNVKVEAVYNYDLDTENNVAEGNVNVRQSTLARVNDLTAETGGWPAVELKWSAPVIEDVQSEIITEDFEDQEIFVPLSLGGIDSDNHVGAFGSWTLYDGNGIDTYSFSGATYENAYAPMAYQVFNPTVAGYDLSQESVAAMLSPNSGDQFLMSFSTTDGKAGDKWLISPMLSGEAQTISFFVSEITDSYGPELYEVWYSTSDNDVASFVKLDEGSVSSTDWTEVTYDLPAGAKYFAIRMVSVDVFGFEVDDITFAAAAAKKLSLATEVTGYNIYRDGELIATVGADVNRYIDVNETDGEHTYYVTVLYGEKESGLSNGATVVTAISELTSDASLQDADITVYATNGAIVASGKGVYNGLAKGVYVIRNNETGLVKGVSKK